MTFNSPEEIIKEFRAGRMVILVDDEDRENEGDLVLPASCVEPEHINFMARYARGLICLTLTRERCEQLGLRLMVSDNREAQATAFTASIDAAHNITTGISASDRATTIRVATAADATPADIVQPGHIFPVMAEPGGVLTRAGHTEAGCDLARLAGHEPCAAIVEVLNEDGTMARRPDLERFSTEHELKIGTIADLINYRMMNEKTVSRVAECSLPTRYGNFRLVAYEDMERAVHLALVTGDIDPEKPTLIRVHVQDSLSDLTESVREDAGWPLSDALKRVSEGGTGVVVILRHPEKSADVIKRIESYQAQDRGQHHGSVERGSDLRTYGLGAQMLLDLGVRKMRVLSAPKRMHGISGFGLEVVEYVV